MSARVLVLADDFTGGNAVAAGFARIGLRAATVSSARHLRAAESLRARCDVLVVSTDSRHSTADEAARRVRQAVEVLGEFDLVSNRVDTTLRGNVGATTAALLGMARKRTTRRTVALCAPAHPAAGRQTVAGLQLLHGRRLEDTEIARDGLNPVSTSDVALLATRGTSMSSGRIALDVVTGPAPGLEQALRELAASCDVIVADALSEEHLARVAAAAATLSSDFAWVCVDSGPFSIAMARALGLARLAEGPRAPVLAVSGSVSEVTRRQLQNLAAEIPVSLVLAGFSPESGRLDVDETVGRLTGALHAAAPEEVVLLTSAFGDADVTHLDAEGAERLAADLALIARQAMNSTPVGGIYSTGGDVTVALLEELGVHGLEVDGEVLPLAAAGRLIGGPWDGLPVVTKGGLVGGLDAARLCIDHLMSRRLTESGRAQLSDQPSGTSPDASRSTHTRATPSQRRNHV